jgi:hypothetical protein
MFISILVPVASMIVVLRHAFESCCGEISPLSSPAR